MGSIIQILLGAILAVGTGYVVNFFEFSRKKDHFILGVIHDMHGFVKSTHALSAALSERNKRDNKDWLEITIPNIITRINNARHITNQNKEWFLAINSDRLRDKIENFYWDSVELINKITYFVQDRTNLLNMRTNIMNQAYKSGITEPKGMIKRAYEMMPIEMGLIDVLENKIVTEVEKLIDFQSSAKELSAELIEEYSLLKKGKKFISRYRFNCQSKK